jgi:uncharacterized membrane protein HdeD (DUF308 family)
MEITIDRSLRHWWVFIIRGILFILLGVYMFCAPANGYLALSFLFGAAILVAGISELMHSYQYRGKANRGWHLFAGLIELLLGFVLISHLAASEIILRFIIGLYFLFRAIMIFSLNGITRSWWVNLSGLVILALALLILINPVFGAMTIVLWTGLAFLFTGLMNVLLGIHLKHTA